METLPQPRIRLICRIGPKPTIHRKEFSMKKTTRKARKKKSAALQVIEPMVAGIDIGSRDHWVCGPFDESGSREVRRYGTTTVQLERLADWLAEEGVKSVAMESTYVYWIPVYELLESRGFEVLLVNARQLHNVPGRKTDKEDCKWIQRLHSCGLLRGSFRPHETICRIRTIKRQQENLLAERTRAVQWMQKSLNQMNVQVHHAVSDLTGSTGISIIRAIVNGERNPRLLATLRDPRCRKTNEEIAEHLTGTWREEHLFNLKSALHLYDEFQNIIDSYEARLMKEYEAFQPPERRKNTVPQHPNPAKQKLIKQRGKEKLRASLYRAFGVDLTRIDGISPGTAQIILTEVGPDISAFPTEKDFTSWLKLVPRTPITGGKPIKGKGTKGLGSTRIAGNLRMAALSLKRSKSALGAEFRRLARQKEWKVAIIAIARKLAVNVYRMLRYGTDYVDLGEKEYERRYLSRRVTGLTMAAKALGYNLIKTDSCDEVSA